MKRKLRHCWWCVLVLAACGTSTQVTSTTDGYQNLYQSDALGLHPEVLLYHHKEDSSTLHFRIWSDDLLYSRRPGSDAFSADMDVKYVLKQKSNGVVADSGSFYVRNESGYDKRQLIKASLVLPIKVGNFDLELRFKERYRFNEGWVNIQVDKDDTENAQNFLFFNDSLNEPIFDRCISSKIRVRVRNERSVKAIKVYRFESISKLPPPPFSNSGPEYPDPKTGILQTNVECNGRECVLYPQYGFYFVTCDEMQNAGISLLVSTPYFPRVATTEQLVYPLRFITSKSEYDEILKAKYTKKFIDKFWMECAGGKPKAKEMIAAYYKRVQEANIYFSTYTEGWRTDRGMILLVFGHPNKIIRKDNSELWVYGEVGSPNSLTFLFDKMQSVFSDNVYVMRRDPLYKQVWEQMVTAWRSGRVYLN